MHVEDHSKKNLRFAVPAAVSEPGVFGADEWGDLANRRPSGL
jgi:hypothetical protein